tara:strand:+ start:10 stop:315 length:306 start_codon:yes stop_codon:yes gene_type:complete
MEVDYDAVNESILESIMEDIGGMNVIEFVESLWRGTYYKDSRKDHADAAAIVEMACVYSMTVNDTLDYLEEHYQFDDHNVYEEFVHIITREIDRQFEERGR